MEFTALFLAGAIAMLVAWRGPRSLALILFAVVLIAGVATYLHHATDLMDGAGPSPARLTQVAIS